jgi:hypothetical protein
MATRDLNSGQYVGSRQLLDLTPTTLVTQADEVTDGLTEINTDGIIMHPNSPHPLNFQWAGSEIDLLAVITPDLFTEYNTVDVEPKVFYFYTKDEASISPSVTGTVGDAKSIGADTEVFLGASDPIFDYSVPSEEHLVTWNVDPTGVSIFFLASSGIQSIANLEPFTEMVTLELSSNPFTDTPVLELPSIPSKISNPRLHDIIYITGINNSAILNKTQVWTSYFCPNLTHVDPPISAFMTSFLSFSCANLVSVGTFENNPSLTTLRLEGCALEQTYVDQVINDQYINGQPSGLINLSGGTNAKRTLASLVGYNDLVGYGVTITDNGIESTQDSLLWFKTIDQAVITPSFGSDASATGDWVDNEGQLYEDTDTTTFTFGTPANEHLISLDNVDPLDVHILDLRDDNVTEVDVGALPNLRLVTLFGNLFTGVIGLELLNNVTRYTLYNNVNLEEVHIGDGSNAVTFQVYTCPNLTTLSGTETLTLLTSGYFVMGSNLTGELVVPIAPLNPTFRASDNPLTTSTTTFLGCLALTDIQLQGCALDLVSVDQVFDDMFANGMTTGLIDTSGGTNAIPSPSLLLAGGSIFELLALGVTCTYNT